MIKRSTVLILGAGASVPFGFPSGHTLRDKIVTGVSKPSAQLFGLLQACQFDARQITAFGQDLRRSGQPSVDAFLEYRPEFLDLGKTAIAAELIPYEVEDKLFGGERNWYEYVFKRLGDSPVEIAESKLAVITFNYDRSLEHFLWTALRSSHQMPRERIASHMRAIPIVHVYGKLGELPDEDPVNGRRYQPIAAPTASQLAFAKDQIKIVPEGAARDEGFTVAYELIAKAKVICFLGFGYLPKNVDRLSVDSWPAEATLYGSAKGLAYPGEQDPIKALFKQPIELGKEGEDVFDFLRYHRVLA